MSDDIANDSFFLEFSFHVVCKNYDFMEQMVGKIWKVLFVLFSSVSYGRIK